MAGGMRRSGSSWNVAYEAVRLLRRILSQARFTQLNELLNVITTEGKAMASAEATELVVGNMVLRVLKLIREEYGRLMRGADVDEVAVADPYDSLHKLWRPGDEERVKVSGKELKGAVIQILGELLAEMETARDLIAAQSLDHVFSGDLVLTLGDSLTIEAFLSFVGKKRKFQVLVVEKGSRREGSEMAARLEKSGVAAACVPDAQVFSRMAHASKVLLAAHSVLADGGFLAPAGTYSLALAAKYYSVPVIVCAGFYKLTPKFLSGDHEGMKLLASPRHCLPFCHDDLLEKVEVCNPTLDCVPPELVSLYISSHTAGSAPSYVYRLLTDLYHPDDVLHFS